MATQSSKRSVSQSTTKSRTLASLPRWWIPITKTTSQIHLLMSLDYDKQSTRQFKRISRTNMLSKNNSIVWSIVLRPKKMKTALLFLSTVHIIDLASSRHQFSKNDRDSHQLFTDGAIIHQKRGSSSSSNLLLTNISSILMKVKNRLKISEAVLKSKSQD